jgi:hypothetical protein
MASFKRGKLGRNPSDPVRLRRMIRLKLTGALPPIPVSADHFALVKRWMDGGNFDFGTCGPTSIANFLVMVYKVLTGEDITVTNDDVFDLYRRSGNPNFNPDTGADDNGVDMTVMFDALLKGGIWITHADGRRELVKPLCYAAVDTDITTQRTVTAVFGGPVWGVTLQTAQQSQSVWDYKRSATWGGHAIPGGSFTSQGGAGQVDESIVSWTDVIGTTDAFVANQLDESYIPVFRVMWDHPNFIASVDQAALASAYETVTGRTFPVPVPQPPEPPPGPNPPPPPSPSPGCLPGLALIAGAVYWAAHTGMTPVTVAKHIRDLAAALGIVI